VATFDLVGALRRIRRRADMSQRELAEACGISQSAVAHAETGVRDLPVGVLRRAAAVAGLRLALLDEDGQEAVGMAHDTVRDLGGRRFPAHLDTHHSDERPGRYQDRYYRPVPTFTVDRDRRARDAERRRRGSPDDHHVPRVGDSPEERAAARRAEALRRHHEETRRRFLAGEPAHVGEPFECTCPPRCDELDDREGRPVHAEECPCNCDVA
jgi:transcriptional regulator with XRE-family HTH domain